MAESPASKLFGVTGRPVLHSRSPQLFHAAFAALDLPHRYLRLAARDAVEAEGLADALGLSAFNVTAPHKAALAKRVRLEGAAASLAAVNTVVRNGAGWRGLNTDGAGVVGALTASGLSLPGLAAVVVGAGGAGRAAAAGLVDAGARVTLVNRTRERAEQVSRSLGCRAGPLSDLPALLADARVLVACLPGDASVIAPAWLHPKLTVLEADYAHARLAAAGAAGCRVVPGTQWLLYQALAGFEHMVGRPAPVEAVGAGLAARPPDASTIALVGFMGAGKTSVGRALAGRLGYGFVDLDAVIVDRAGASVGEVFARQGEAAFRSIEKEALDAVAGLPRTVIACGGGVVVDGSNRRRLARGLTVWLWSDLQTCLDRSRGTDRPLLAGPVRPAELFEQRRLLYAGCAGLVVDTRDEFVEGVVDGIVDEVRGLQDD